MPDDVPAGRIHRDGRDVRHPGRYGQLRHPARAGRAGRGGRLRRGAGQAGIRLRRGAGRAGAGRPAGRASALVRIAGTASSTAVASATPRSPVPSGGERRAGVRRGPARPARCGSAARRRPPPVPQLLLVVHALTLAPCAVVTGCRASSASRRAARPREHWLLTLPAEQPRASAVASIDRSPK